MDTAHVICPACRAINRVAAADLGRAPDCGRCHQPLFTGQPVVLDAAGFERERTRGGLPLLVDFWAPWCGPCRLMAPAYAQAAVLLEPQVRVAKLDTEQAPALAAQLGIRSIPTLALFRGGRELARQAGALTRAQDVVQWARGHLG